MKCSVIGCPHDAETIRGGNALCAYHNELEMAEIIEAHEKASKEAEAKQDKKK